METDLAERFYTAVRNLFRISMVEILLPAVVLWKENVLVGPFKILALVALCWAVMKPLVVVINSAIARPSNPRVGRSRFYLNNDSYRFSSFSGFIVPVTILAGALVFAASASDHALVRVLIYGCVAISLAWVLTYLNFWRNFNSGKAIDDAKPYGWNTGWRGWILERYKKRLSR
jgi:hypothetical protein